jgi:propanol-preferring alcohol dehydrogenase
MAKQYKAVFFFLNFYMKSWIIDRISDLHLEAAPLRRVELPVPQPQAGQVLLKVKTCGICHTEIDEIEGRTPPPHYPTIPGHQVIGTIVDHQGKRQSIKNRRNMGAKVLRV